MKNKLTERECLIIEQAKNIREYCRSCQNCDGCIFLREDDIHHTSDCLLQWSDPERWKLPEVEG